MFDDKWQIKCFQIQSSYQDSGEEQGAYSNDVVESFPREFGYIPFDGSECNPTSSSDEQKPRILLMGLRRSGKSSIQKVVFHKMSPNGEFYTSEIFVWW